MIGRLDKPWVILYSSKAYPIVKFFSESDGVMGEIRRLCRSLEPITSGNHTRDYKRKMLFDTLAMAYIEALAEGELDIAKALLKLMDECHKTWNQATMLDKLRETWKDQ